MRKIIEKIILSILNFIGLNIIGNGKRNDTKDTEVKSERTDGHTSSERTEHEVKDTPVLETETKTSGTRDAESEKQGQTGHPALGWNFSKIWNSSLEDRKEWEMKPRDHMWASELGKPYIDVFLRMKGTKQTNPPDSRSMRKFEAGNIWEWIVQIILIRAGILKSQQDRIEYQYEGLIKVTGKLDFLAGGKPVYDEDAFKDLELPPAFNKVYKDIVDHFNKTHPGGLDVRVLEVKSVSAYMYELLEKNKNSSLKIHRLQLYHYLKGKQIKIGHIVYICRDDCRMMEIPVSLNGPVEKEYRDYIAGLTHYISKDERPPIEQCIVFDEDFGRFSKNNQVAWSGYLTMLYGFKNQAEFDDAYKKKSERWNRVLGRMKEGKEMTKSNLEALEEIEKEGFDMDYVKSKLVISKDNEEQA